MSTGTASRPSGSGTPYLCKLVVSATGDSVTPTGRVTVRVAGRTVAGTLSRGVAVLKLGRLKAGRHTAAVKYAGDSLHTGSTTSVRLRVRR